MSRPLVLTVNRPFEDLQGNAWYVWGDTAVRDWVADGYAERKRLTGPELAAEWHRSAAVTGIHGPHIEGARTETLHRFATLPHYDGDRR